MATEQLLQEYVIQVRIGANWLEGVDKFDTHRNALIAISGDISGFPLRIIRREETVLTIRGDGSTGEGHSGLRMHNLEVHLTNQSNERS